MSSKRDNPVSNIQNNSPLKKRAVRLTLDLEFETNSTSTPSSHHYSTPQRDKHAPSAMPTPIPYTIGSHPDPASVTSPFAWFQANVNSANESDDHDGKDHVDDMILSHENDPVRKSAFDSFDLSDEEDSSSMKENAGMAKHSSWKAEDVTSKTISTTPLNKLQDSPSVSSLHLTPLRMIPSYNNNNNNSNNSSNSNSMNVDNTHHPAIFGSVLMGEALRGINTRLRASPVSTTAVTSNSNGGTVDSSSSKSSTKYFNRSPNGNPSNIDMFGTPIHHHFRNNDAASNVKGEDTANHPTSVNAGLVMTPLVVPSSVIQSNSSNASSSPSTNTNQPVSTKQMVCNCTKSQCLKLYCQCFAQLSYCGSSCNCQDCYNREVCSDDDTNVNKDEDDTAAPTADNNRNNRRNRQHMRKLRQQAIASARSKNPNAFGGVGGVGGSGERERVGCKCKKSGCLKRYCECYQAGLLCLEKKCKCVSCKNYAGSVALQDQQRRRRRQEQQQHTLTADTNMNSSSHHNGTSTIPSLASDPNVVRASSTLSHNHTPGSTFTNRPNATSSSSTLSSSTSDANNSIGSNKNGTSSSSSGAARSNRSSSHHAAGSYPTPTGHMMQLHHPHHSNNATNTSAAVGYHPNTAAHPLHNMNVAGGTQQQLNVVPYNTMLAAAWMATAAAAAAHRGNGAPANGSATSSATPNMSMGGMMGMGGACMPMWPNMLHPSMNPHHHPAPTNTNNATRMAAPGPKKQEQPQKPLQEDNKKKELSTSTYTSAPNTSNAATSSNNDVSDKCDTNNNVVNRESNVKGSKQRSKSEAQQVCFQITSDIELPGLAAYKVQSYLTNEDLLNASIVCKSWYKYQELALWR